MIMPRQQPGQPLRLLLVAALADEWDVRPRPYGIGKVVWFTVKLPVASPGTAGGHA
jgi:hypothetical protein